VPERPLRRIVPFAPGGSTDLGGRIVAERGARRWGSRWPRGHRGRRPRRAAPDGHTLLVGTNGAVTTAPHLGLMRQVGMRHELAPVSLLFATKVIVVVHAGMPARTIGAFVAHARANPDRTSCGSLGVGTGTHICTELFQSVAGLRMERVPCRGSGQAISDLVSRTIQVMLDQPASSIAQARQGSIRALATSGPRRNPLLPGVPTFAEVGLGAATAQSWGA
jgi:tripartite-type tricarboxylate transporter receptor subunit TctC